MGTDGIIYITTILVLFSFVRVRLAAQFFRKKIGTNLPS